MYTWRNEREKKGEENDVIHAKWKFYVGVSLYGCVGSTGDLVG